METMHHQLSFSHVSQCTRLTLATWHHTVTLPVLLTHAKMGMECVISRLKHKVGLFKRL